MYEDLYEDLNEKQVEILHFIKSQIKKQGYPPAVREICTGVGLSSTSSVHGHLESLAAKGYIKKDPTKPRAIQVLDKGPDALFPPKKTIDIPVVGKIISGQPILTTEYIEDTFPVDVELAEKGPLFILKIEGNSMVEAGVLNGDYVLVKKQDQATNGDIVVALLGEKVAVKTFFKEKDYIRLQPENKSMSPIVSKDVTILGKVIALYRRM